MPTNPTEGLTDELVAVLRSLPRVVLDDDIHDLTDSVLAVNDFQEGDDYFIRTRAGDLLLATIDRRKGDNQ